MAETLPDDDLAIAGTIDVLLRALQGTPHGREVIRSLPDDIRGDLSAAASDHRERAVAPQTTTTPAPTRTTPTRTATRTSKGSTMPASTNQAAAGGKPTITFPKPATSKIEGNNSGLAYTNDAKAQFHQLANYFEAMHAAVVADVTEFLRANGLDGQRQVAGFAIGGSDARSTARKAAKPLKNAAADAENIAKHMGVLQRLLDGLVWDPAFAAEKAAEQAKRTNPIRLGA
jgi:hypothetical protein